MNLNRQILRLAIPSIVSNITVPLLGLCDTGIAGHLGSASYLGAIAVGTMAINAIFWCLGFLRMGTTGLTAQAFGASDLSGCKLLFSRATILAFALGVAIIIVSHPLQWFIFSIISAEQSVSTAASEYFHIVILAAPAQLATMAISGWFLGMQTSLQPMVIAITTNLLNILLSLLFVFSFNMGFTGTAYGTFAAGWAGLLTALALVWMHQGGKLPALPVKKIVSKSGWSRFFSVNIYIFLRSFCIMAVTMGVTSQGARLGTATLAANTVIMQFFIIFSYFIDGFAFSAEALTGKAAGERNRNMLRKTVLRIFMWGGSVMILFFIIYLCLHSQIASLITDDSSTLRLIDNYSIWIMAFPLAGGAAFILDGIFIGLTRTMNMLASALLGLLGFYTIVLLLPHSDANFLWFAFVLYLLLRGVLLAAMLPRASRLACA